MKRALVVAHPDDESLFFGGIVIAEPGDWTIICCSIPRHDPIRAEKFNDACAVLGGRPVLLPFQEGDPREALPGQVALDLDSFDQIVTHNCVGEYGHRQHVLLHRHIADRWSEKMMTDGYGMEAGDHRIALTQHQFGRKMMALQCYDHVSPTDGKPKWRALIERYGSLFDLAVETYARA